MKRKLPTLIKDYEPNNVFNSDETALFYKGLPDKAMVFKTAKCHEGKHSKEKLKSLVIGSTINHKKPMPALRASRHYPWNMLQIRKHGIPATYL